MNRREFLSASLAAAAPSLAQNRLRATPDRPNIVFIMADDLGYGDLSCYGAEKVRTPEIDSLARDGVLFTDAHSPSAVCTPTRYGVLTGRYCWRTQLKHDCLFGHDPLLIEQDRMTVASLLKTAGYATACIGKWHLGFGRSHPDWNGELKPGPLEVGFDYYFGIPVTNAQAPYVYVENHRVVGLDPKDPILLGPDSKTNVMEGGKAARYKPEELALTNTGKAVAFIERNRDRRFFLYFTPSNVHGPYTPNPRFRGTSECGVYCDFIRELDWSVGEVLRTLEKCGLRENTLVVFTSDNGGLYYRDAYNRGHRPNLDLLGQKTDAWEGGHRVPFLARWPRKIEAASRSNQLICLVDFMATAAAIAGVALPADAAPDSCNVLPALAGRPAEPVRRAAVILASAEGMLAVRQGEWVLILGRGSGGSTTDYGRHYGMRLEELGRSTTGWAMKGMGPDPSLPRGQLYNLAADRGQAENVYAEHPEIVRRLSELLMTYRARGRSRD